METISLLEQVADAVDRLLRLLPRLEVDDHLEVHFQAGLNEFVDLKSIKYT